MKQTSRKSEKCIRKFLLERVSFIKEKLNALEIPVGSVKFYFRGLTPITS